VLPSAGALSLYGEVTFPLSHQNLSAPETTAEGAINYIIDASNHLKGEANDCRNRLEDLEDSHVDLEVLVQQLRDEIASLRAEVERLQFMVDGQGAGNSGGPVGIYNPDE
jgi:predicted RNase H-like nuclease (RuvC/YqgF family)